MTLLGMCKGLRWEGREEDSSDQARCPRAAGPGAPEGKVPPEGMEEGWGLLTSEPGGL